MKNQTEKHSDSLPHIELGAGLLAFSRPWPRNDSYVPNDTEATQHLEKAYYVHGVRFFDTSGSSYDSLSPDGMYRSSEERLGKFLQTLSKNQRRHVTVSTKAGWHFDQEKNDYYVDHRFIPLVKSINQSIRRLHTVPDILFIQKLSSEALTSRRKRLAIHSAILYGRLRGIKHIGGSHATEDLEAARIIAKDRRFSHQQLSFNQEIAAEDSRHEEVFRLAQANEKCLVINRAFNMGNCMNNDTNSASDEKAVNAFSRIINQADGKNSVVILTGTVNHLDENVEAFHKARRIVLSRHTRLKRN